MTCLTAVLQQNMSLRAKQRLDELNTPFYSTEPDTLSLRVLF